MFFVFLSLTNSHSITINPKSASVIEVSSGNIMIPENPSVFDGFVFNSDSQKTHIFGLTDKYMASFNSDGKISVSHNSTEPQTFVYHIFSTKQCDSLDVIVNPYDSHYFKASYSTKLANNTIKDNFNKCFCYVLSKKYQISLKVKDLDEDGHLMYSTAENEQKFVKVDEEDTIEVEKTAIFISLKANKGEASFSFTTDSNEGFLRLTNENQFTVSGLVNENINPRRVKDDDDEEEEEEEEEKKKEEEKQQQENIIIIASTTSGSVVIIIIILIILCCCCRKKRHDDSSSFEHLDDDDDDEYNRKTNNPESPYFENNSNNEGLAIPDYNQPGSYEPQAGMNVGQFPVDVENNLQTEEPQQTNNGFGSSLISSDVNPYHSIY